MEIIPNKTFFNLSEAKRERILKASMKEFAIRSFDEAKLSNIIRDSQIPRGSFYQYFKDKKDIYFYIMKYSRSIKMEYLSDSFARAGTIPFLDLFRELFVSGIEFAVNNPELESIGRILVTNKGPIYDEIMKDGIAMVIKMYTEWIDIDKEKGLIRKDIDSKLFASLIIDLSNSILIDILKEEYANYDDLLNRIDNLIIIFRRGIE